MKNFLLLTAIAAGAMSMNAQSVNDYYNVTFHGQTLENNGVVVAEDWDEEAGWFHADIEFTPKVDIENCSFNVVGEYTGTPTSTQWQTDVEAWGMPSICWASGATGNCEITDQDNSSYFTNFTIGNEKITKGQFTVQFHVLGQDGEVGPDFNPSDPSTWPKPIPPTNTSYYKIVVTPTVNGQSVGSFTTNLYIGLDAEDFSGVEEVIANNDAPVVYFDLTGRKIANPAKGQIIIERKGLKAVKKIIL